jgi:hypothetical protein
VRGLVYALGRYPAPGVVVLLMAGTALFAWEARRLSSRPGRARYLLVIGCVAISLTGLSLVLIACRFIAVEKL